VNRLLPLLEQDHEFQNENTVGSDGCDADSDLGRGHRIQHCFQTGPGTAGKEYLTGQGSVNMNTKTL